MCDPAITCVKPAETEVLSLVRSDSFLLVQSPSPVSLAGNIQLKQSQGSKVTSFSLAAAIGS